MTTQDAGDDLVMPHHPTVRESSRILGGVIADVVNEKVGTWTYLILQNALIVAWVILNGTGAWQPDPFPFILLNLLLSMQAANTGPMLLISANRAAARDRAVLHHIDVGMSQMAESHDAMRAEQQAFRTEILALLKHAHKKV
jgi:uncharacterized membrane protein